MGRESFVGTWNLVVMEFRSDGQVVYPVGRNAVGLSIYDGAGHVSTQIMTPGRPAFESGDQLLGTPEEVRGALQGYIAYCGTYSVDEARSVVTHHVTCSLYPNWVGTDQRRYYKLSGDRLIISAPTHPIGGHLMDVMLIWDRVHPH